MAQHTNIHGVSGRMQGAPGMTPGAAPSHGPKEQMLGAGVIRNSPARLAQSKAAEILEDGTVHGKPLTGKQKKYMRAIAHGMKPRKPRGKR